MICDHDSLNSNSDNFNVKITIWGLKSLHKIPVEFVRS